MGLLSGSASVTRFNVTGRPEEPGFDQEAFREIAPGSELRESVGFVPFEPEAPYRVGQARFAFRMRVDKVRPDPTAVQERLKQLVAAEAETTGAAFVGPKKRKKLRELAEEELLHQSSPRSKIVEAVIDGKVLYVASTSDDLLGRMVQLLRRIGIAAEPKAPWLDRDEAELESEVIEATAPGQSVLGCRFLRELVGDAEILYEPEAGSVRLATHDTRVSLTGAVLKDLYRYLERGAEVLAAKLITAETGFRLEGLSFRLSGLKVETGRHEHWTQLLDERLEKIAAICERLDAKFAELSPRLRQKAAGGLGRTR